MDKTLYELESLYGDEICAEAAVTDGNTIFKYMPEYLASENDGLYPRFGFSAMLESVSPDLITKKKVLRCVFAFMDSKNNKRYKERPCVIVEINNTKIAIPIFSIWPEGDHRYNPKWKKIGTTVELNDWDYAKLDHKSYAKTSRFILAEKADFIPYKYEYVSDSDYKRIISGIFYARKMLHENPFIFMEWLFSMDVGMDKKPESGDNDRMHTQNLKSILKTFKGNCVDFASCFHEVCDNGNIENVIVKTSFHTPDHKRSSGHVYCIFKQKNQYYACRYIPEIKLATFEKYNSIDDAVEGESKWLRPHHESVLGCKGICKNIIISDKSLKVWDDCVKKNMTQRETISAVLDSMPLYFYHLAPEDADISKGLLSPYAAYKIGNKELISSMLNKYRNRAVNQWKFYPDRDPESLTVEELIDSLNKVRGKDGDKCIYFFKYPPYTGLGKNMKKSLEKYHVPYRININDPELKKHIIRIDWGWPQSDFTKPPLTKDYYLNVSKEEYFSKYTDNPKPGQPIFAPMSHISIAFKNGICPAKFLERMTPEKMKHLDESFREMLTANTGEEIYYESLLHRATESVSSFSKDSNLFLSEDDIYCNFWDFENNRTHYCFVIGFSGSGKTNLARNLAKKYRAEWVSLDVLLYDSRVHRMTERFVSGMQKQRLLAKYLKETNIDLSYMKDVTYKETPEARRIMVETGRKFVDWLIHKNKEPVIIEGLDLIDIIPTDPSLYSAPIVFKGTSRLLSMFRRLQRSKFKTPLAVVMRMFSWYKTDAHGIDYLRSIVIGDYNYQYRPEPGAYDPGHQYRNTYN